MIVRRSYAFTDWTRWDDVLDESVQDFRERTMQTPGSVVASSATWHRIDMLVANTAQRANVRGPDGEQPEDDEFPAMTSFRGPDYELDFCVGDDLPLGIYVLLHAPSTEEGEVLPQEDTPDVVVRLRAVEDDE